MFSKTTALLNVPRKFSFVTNRQPQQNLATQIKTHGGQDWLDDIWQQHHSFLHQEIYRHSKILNTNKMRTSDYVIYFLCYMHMDV